MKKALLVVALTAAISGQAQAWTNGSIGGTFEMGGTITQQPAPVMIWEAKLGSATGLNVTIPRNNLNFNIPVATDIPVLGFRVTETSGLFTAVAGSTNNPKISYGGKLDLNSFANGVGNLTLDVLDTSNNKIGTLTAKMTTAGIASKVAGGNAEVMSLYAPDNAATDAFSGGLPVTAGQAMGASADAVAAVNKFFPDVHFSAQAGTAGTTAKVVDLNDTSVTSYSSAYAAGISSGTQLSVVLDAMLQADTVWKATLPVTISYS